MSAFETRTGSAQATHQPSGGPTTAPLVRAVPALHFRGPHHPPQARVGFGGAALYGDALPEGECSTVGFFVCCPTTSTTVSANCRDALVGEE